MFFRNLLTMTSYSILFRFTSSCPQIYACMHMQISCLIYSLAMYTRPYALTFAVPVEWIRTTCCTADRSSSRRKTLAGLAVVTVAAVGSR